MNVTLCRRMAQDECLAWKRGQELRGESHCIQPVAMTGGAAKRSGIATDPMDSLRQGLRGKPCRALRRTWKSVRLV
jgi:hypothetical protein